MVIKGVIKAEPAEAALPGRIPRFFALSPVSNQVIKKIEKEKKKWRLQIHLSPSSNADEMQERPLLPTAGAVTNTALQVLLACLCPPAGEQTELGCGLISTYLQTEDAHAVGPSQRGLSLYCQAPPRTRRTARFRTGCHEAKRETRSHPLRRATPMASINQRKRTPLFDRVSVSLHFLFAHSPPHLVSTPY